MRFEQFSQVGMSALAMAMLSSVSPVLAQSLPVDPTVLTQERSVTPHRGALDPFRGALDPFRGSLDPFRGNIDPFRGSLDPFRGSLDPFRGSLDPFATTSPLTAASVSGFWTQFATDWTALDTALTTLGNAKASASEYQQAVTLFQNMNGNAEKFWGVRVTGKSGKDFKGGFLDKLLSKYGLSLSDPASFAKLTASQRSNLAFDYYDGLNEFSGIDHVDHWMKMINWNPTLTKRQGSGADSVIGLLDAAVVNDADIANNLTSTGGYKDSASGHGTAVASLLVAAHDGKGVQGIAPNASVVAYNPFDASGTASWDDVRAGIVDLKRRGASVVNVSLGVKGWTLHSEWNNIFSNPAVAAAGNDTVFVIAAGNDGSTQTKNIAWNMALNPALIVVGSVDPNGKISDFSNRPGSACLLQGGVCLAGSKLADRFVVAPGELMLVSDGNGGLGRASGTSFAAPLVSGTIALLHDRWPWLANHPKESVDIVLSTAKDLGAPGTDEVYGRGLVDVEAAQSPINFDNLVFYQFRDGRNRGTYRTAAAIKAGGVKPAWEANGVFFYAFEDIGATYRDFAIPVSSRLVGQTTKIGGSEEYFQDYITDRLTDWINDEVPFTDVTSFGTRDPNGWNYSFQGSSPANYLSKSGVASSRYTSVKVSDPAGRFGFSGGHGSGGRALAGQKGFNLTSDYDAGNGGVNPLLGLASGGAFMGADMAIGGATRVGIGMTERTLVHSRDLALSDSDRNQLREVDPYRASALNLRVTHKASEAITLTLDYTKLREANGLLGVQSTEASDLRSGSSSETATFGASMDLPGNMTFATSMSAAMTRTNGRGRQALSTDGAVLSSAFAASLTKRGLMGRRDVVRIAVAQPLHIERGELAFTGAQIVDRSTGELGDATQNFDISDGSRRFVGELLYAAPIVAGGEISFFGRAEYNAASKNAIDGMVIGGRVRLGF
jgi:Subtilase family